MKKEILDQALNEISDAHLEEAVKKGSKQHHPVRWLGAVAAAVALALVLHMFLPGSQFPVLTHAQALSEASNPRVMDFPQSKDYPSNDAWVDAIHQFDAQKENREHLGAQSLTNADVFFKESIQLCLSKDGNQVWSPVNGYISLAMLAEVTGGDTRQEILDALGTENLDLLRSQTSALWELCYSDDKHETSQIANALFVDQDLACHQEPMDALAHHYYASVYQGDLESKGMLQDLQRWLSSSTGKKLDDQISDLNLPADAAMVLASTVFIESKWGYDSKFSKGDNTSGTFHSPGGDVECTFMNHTESRTYYWGDSFSAISRPLLNGCSFWLILPDENKTPRDVLQDGQYFDLITAEGQFANNKYMKVNLSLPKFDVASSCDLAETFQDMGIQKVFDPAEADFSPSVDTSTPLYLSSAQQAARVTIDEKGVTAATYIVSGGAGSAEPASDEIDFVLDRPFLFAITRGGVPMFTGTVENP